MDSGQKQPSEHAVEVQFCVKESKLSVSQIEKFSINVY